MNRKILFFLLFLCFSINMLFSQKNTVIVTEENFTKIIIESVIDEIKCIEKNYDGVSYSLLNLSEQYVSSKKIGAPELPVNINLIEIPEGANVLVRIVEDNVKIIDLKDLGCAFPLFPVQKSLSKNGVQGELVQDGTIYEKDDFFGFDKVSVEEMGYLNGTKLGKVKISPISYNPLLNQIKVSQYLKIEIVFENANLQKTLTEKRRRNVLYNYSMDKKVINSKNFNPNQSEFPIQPYKYVILSVRGFEETLQPFIQWKKEKGFNIVEVYAGDAEVGDTPDEIRAYLKEIYESATIEDPAPTFLLIAGSNSIIPAFQVPLPPNLNLYPLTYDHSPTDLYYAEYTNDIYPDLFYGRFPAENAEELSQMINKTIEYEKYQMTNKAYLSNGLFVSGENRNETNGVLNYLKSTYSENINESVYLKSNSSMKIEEIKEKIRIGNSFIYYTGHCNNTGWNGLRGNAFMEILDNQKYFLSVNNCCLSNKFDLGTPCFGEMLIAASDAGAIGVIGASNETFWEEDYIWAVGAKSLALNPSYNSDALGAFDRFFHTHNEGMNEHYITQGQIVTAGNLAISQSESFLEKFYWEIYHLFGDPSLMPYVGTPKQLNIKMPSAIELGTQSIVIEGVPLSYVSILQGNETIGAGVVGEDGKLKVELSYPENNEPFEIIATKQFYQPYFGSVSVTSPSPKVEDFESNSFTQFRWVNKSTSPWMIEQNKNFVYQGDYCARSGKISHGKTSSLSVDIDVFKDDTIHFYVRISSEEDADFLLFFINSELKESWSGERAWQKVSIPISLGKKTLTWQYGKDLETSSGYDCVWIDNIEFPLLSSVLSITPGKEVKEIEIYPNPTSGLVTVNFPQDSNKYDGYVYNLSGKLMKEKKNIQNGDQLSLEDLSNGIYLFILRNDKQHWVKKIILTR